SLYLRRPPDLETSGDFSVNGGSRPMNAFCRHAGTILVALVLTTAGACFGPPNTVAPDDTGSVSASLQLTPTTTLDTASYSITGPRGFSRMGTTDVSHSQTISATIGGIPAGSGYSVAISATASDGVTLCSGSAMFSIAAKMTSLVSIHIQCREPAKTGS